MAKEGNLKKWILEIAQAQDEEVEAVVIGEMGDGDYGSEGVPHYEAMPRGKILSWKEAAPWLDYDFDDSFGAPRCNAVYAWTKNWVIAIGTYDGSTWPYAIPRHPIDIMPGMQGGG